MDADWSRRGGRAVVGEPPLRLTPSPPTVQMESNLPREQHQLSREGSGVDIGQTPQVTGSDIMTQQN